LGGFGMPPIIPESFSENKKCQGPTVWINSEDAHLLYLHFINFN
jgi:hypothetical protein